MQALLASLVFSMSVKDDAYKAGMAAARAEAKKTGQDFDRSSDQMGNAVERAARQVNLAAVKIADSVAKVGRDVQNAGLKLTAGLSLPLGLLAHTAKETASDFEAGMNRVHAAMLGASPEELDKLRNAALTLGPAFGKSAIEAAESIESLAKNGLDASSILSGGLAAALKLGVVGQTDLGSAADATTDILQQFHLSTGQLPGVVNKVSGALDASKLSFDGYKDAIGQVGGIAGGLGYQFDDMNTALAAVIPLMTGGSDAGTSFKTFLLSLTPASKDAKDVMDKLGISFFDANGQAKSLGEVAEVLNTRLAGLNDRSRQQALTKIFGTDGMRVALALMQAGAKGIADMQAQIDKASADQKMEVLLDGEAAATQRVASAWERLKINIGEAGIIQAYTAVKDAIAGMLGVLASAPPWLYSTIVAIGALAASAGPLTLAMLGLAKIALPLLLLRLGPVALGFAALINPIGVAIRLLGLLALKMGVSAAMARFGAALVGVAGPIGILITGLSILIPLFLRKATASEAARAAVDAAREADRKAADVALQLASATGKARLEILAKAKADRIAALAAVAKAKSDMAAARATYVRAKADAEQAAQLSASPADSEGGIGVAQTAAQKRFGQAAANFQASIEALAGQTSALGSLNSAIQSAETASAKPNRDIDFDADDPKKKRTAKGRDTSADDEDYADKLAEVRNARLRAEAELTGSYRAQYAADIDGLAAERASYAKQLAKDPALDDAKRKTLMAMKDAEIAVRKGVAEQNLNNAEAQESYDLARAENEMAQDRARIASDFADSAAGRRDAELRLLDLQRQQEEADLDLILATKATASAEWDNARKRKDALAGIYADRAAQIGRANEGPAASYMRGLTKSASAQAEQIEGIGVDALKDLNTGLTDAIMGTKKLGDAFADMGKRIIASLIDIAIQQAIIKPLANSLFGAGGGGGGGGGSFATLLASFGGGRAKGGSVSASEWYVVGEKGPELFAPGVSGTVIPNSGVGNGRRGGGDQFIDMRGAIVDRDLWGEVNRIASARAGEAYRASAQNTRDALASVARQRL